MQALVLVCDELGKYLKTEPVWIQDSQMSSHKEIRTIKDYEVIIEVRSVK